MKKFIIGVLGVIIILVLISVYSFEANVNSAVKNSVTYCKLGSINK
ncbi:hypothetical protein [uncultured Clostridium sp.]|nr:hypothetical protein [uncultured Clostridium sp.]